MIVDDKGAATREKPFQYDRTLRIQYEYMYLLLSSNVHSEQKNLKKCIFIKNGQTTNECHVWHEELTSSAIS
jgi:hypothetical protein